MALFVPQILLVAGALQGLCVALLLWTRRANQVANRLLAVLLVLIAGQSVLVAFDTREFFVANPHLSKISWLLPTLFGPLIYLFADQLTRRRPRLRGRDAWFFLPFGACLFYLLPYYLRSAAEKAAYLNDFAQASQDDFSWPNQLINGEHVVFVLLAWRVLHRHERRMRNFYSDLSRVRVRWLKQFLGFVLGIMVFGIGAFYARKWHLGALITLYDYHLHYLGAIALIYWVGYKALGQPALFGTPSPPAVQPRLVSAAAASPPGPPTVPSVHPEAVPAHEASSKYLKSTLTPEQAALYQQQLLAYMEEAKPYRQQTLTLQELAQLVGLPKHRLSQLLNEQLGKSFYDFVNEYRVAEVKQLLRNPRFGHYTTLALAEEAGFNSKATFNAVFKKITGLTPTEYAKQAEIVV